MFLNPEPRSLNILLTKKLSSYHLDLIKSWGWKYTVAEALEIVPVEVTEVPAEMNAWIISSRNSWHEVNRFIEDAPADVYCVGEWIKEQWMNISEQSQIKSFENMRSLAMDIRMRNFADVLFFCGDQHRDELEEVLKDTNTTIHKAITHQSILTYPVLKENYDAVFVFSPRSVESLLKRNNFSDRTVFACIGETTLSYVQYRGIQNTFCASYPNSEVLLTEFYHAVS